MTSPIPQRSSTSTLSETGRNPEVFADRLFKRLPDDVSARINDDERPNIARDAYAFFAERPAPVKSGVSRVLAGGEPVTAIRTAMPDCAFIVDSWRAYLHELLRAGELTAVRLLTLHNLSYMARLMSDLRAAILAGELEGVATALLSGAAAGRAG